MIDKTIFSETKRKTVADYVFFIVSLSFSVAVVLLFFLLSKEISSSILNGLAMCYHTIIPTVFPFFIISELLLLLLDFEKIQPLTKIFERLFKINGSALSVFLCGAVCGFPIAVTLSEKLYKSDIISKEECERLIGFSNHASPAFVICAIGIGMRKSAAQGIAIYFISLLSSLICAYIFSLGKTASTRGKHEKSKLGFSLVKSIKRATEATINVCGFITFFSMLIGILSCIIKSDVTLALLSSLLEISNASFLISTPGLFSESLSFALTAFAVTFSGLSVHMQSKSMLIGTDISMKTYYLMKLTSAFISFGIALAIAFTGI